MLPKPHIRSNFRQFFVRGLTILLPSILTIWIIIAAYGFLKDKIANPINAGVRELVLRTTPWPTVLEQQVYEQEQSVKDSPERMAQWNDAGGGREWLRLNTRRQILTQWWKKYPFPMDLIGLVIAVVLIYLVGGLVGSFLGNSLMRWGGVLMQRIPLIRQVYPSVKQVTDTLLGGGGEGKLKFNRVVAVEYPRMGLWSIGLVTGDTLNTIAKQAHDPCLTVFIPSSPTPFTGYVITVPKKDTIDLNISIDEALRFTVSGGVIVPNREQPKVSSV